jgi:hypothetical protein
VVGDLADRVGGGVRLLSAAAARRDVGAPQQQARGGDSHAAGDRARSRNGRDGADSVHTALASLALAPLQRRGRRRRRPHALSRSSGTTASNHLCVIRCNTKSNANVCVYIYVGWRPVAALSTSLGRRQSTALAPLVGQQRSRSDRRDALAHPRRAGSRRRRHWHIAASLRSARSR